MLQPVFQHVVPHLAGRRKEREEYASLAVVDGYRRGAPLGGYARRACFVRPAAWRADPKHAVGWQEQYSGNDC